MSLKKYIPIICGAFLAILFIIFLHDKSNLHRAMDARVKYTEQKATDIVSSLTEVTNAGGVLTIENDSNAAIEIGIDSEGWTDFELDQWVDDEWLPLERKAVDIAGECYEISNGETAQENVDFFRFYGELENGRYRIWLPIITQEGKMRYLCENFLIENNDTE